jgi:hypothetical protein
MILSHVATSSIVCYTPDALKRKVRFLWSFFGDHIRKTTICTLTVNAVTWYIPELTLLLSSISMTVMQFSLVM